MGLLDKAKKVKLEEEEEKVEEEVEEEEIESEEEFRKKLKTMGRKEKKIAIKERKKALKEKEREAKLKEKEAKAKLKESAIRKREELRKKRLEAKEKARLKKIEELEKRAKVIKPKYLEVLPEGVELAGWDRRIIAFIIDLIILGIIILPVAIKSTESGEMGVALAIYLLLPLVYWIALEGSIGQSIGKLIMGTRLINISGRKADTQKALPQAIGKGLLFPLILIFDGVFGIIIYRDLKQRYTQHLTDTIVVLNNEAVKELVTFGTEEKEKKKVKKAEKEDEKEEVIEALMSIKGISKAMAENIYKAGFTSIKSLKEAKVIDFKGIKGIGPATAKKIVAGIKRK